MNNQEVLKESIERAPKEIRVMLGDGAWSKEVEKISKEQNLSQEQEASLNNEVIFVLLGMELYSNLSKNIQDSLSLNPELASKLASSIHSRVLKDVLSLLPTEEEVPETGNKPTIHHELPMVDKQEGLPMVVEGKSQEVEVKKVSTPTPNTESQIDPKPQVKPAVPIEKEVVKEAPAPVKPEPEIKPEPTKPMSPPPTKTNLSNSKPETPPASTRSYPGGVDPYREPLN